MNPLQRAAVRRKSIYLAAILALFTVSIFYRGLEARPAGGESYVWVPFGRDDRPAAPAAANRVGDSLARQTILSQARRLELRELEQGDPEITGEAVRLGLVGSRGFAVAALWYMAIENQKRNDFHKFDQQVKAVTTLQPHFIAPWIFQSWNIAYNVSVEMQSLGDMYFYIARGIELLAEGERRNKRSPDMRYQIAFYYQNKFGVADQVQTLRCLFQLSCIPPDERNPDNLTNPADGAVDPAAFRQFCERHPMLVRRLRGHERVDRNKKGPAETLQAHAPEDVVRFLRDNNKIPSRYKKTAAELLPPDKQFPALPPMFNEGPDEGHPGMPYREDFTGYLAARAWFTYANVLVPPNPRDEQGNPVPSPTPQPGTGPGEYDPFKYRVPRQPMLILFRQGPPRAQTFQAEMLEKDGWFDGEGWAADAWVDDADAWFTDPVPAPGGGIRRQKPPPEKEVKLGGGTPWGQIAWQAAYVAWSKHGYEYGLTLRENQMKQLLEDYARRLDEAQRRRILETNAPPPLPYPGDPTPEQKADPEYMRWHRANSALFFYTSNRSVTNFPYYLASSEAEQQPATVKARKVLWKADQARRLARNVEAIKLYEDGFARWREVLRKNPNFHRSDRSPRIEEDTYEMELDYLRLLAVADPADRLRPKAREEYAKEYTRAAAAATPFAAVLPAPTNIPTDLREAWYRDIAEKFFSPFAGVMSAAELPPGDPRAGTPWISDEIKNGVLMRQGIRKPTDAGPPPGAPPGGPAGR